MLNIYFGVFFVQIREPGGPIMFYKVHLKEKNLPSRGEAGLKECAKANCM